MRGLMTGLLIFTALQLAGCNAADPGIDTSQSKGTMPASPKTPELIRDMSGPSPPAKHSVTRIIEQDPDADGIANSRCIVTETFDAAGNLVSRTREDDFDADGIVDSRRTTEYPAPTSY